MIDLIGRLAGSDNDFKPLKHYVAKVYNIEPMQVGLFSMIRGVPYEYFVKTKPNGDAKSETIYFGNDGSSRTNEKSKNFDERFVEFLVRSLTPNVMVKEQFYIALRDNIHYAYQSKLKDLDANKIISLRAAEKVVYGSIADQDNTRK